MRNLVWLVALALAVVVAAGCVGFFGQGAPQRSHEEINQTIADSNPVISAVSRETDPNLVPIPTAFNQSLAEFWSFTIDGPYSSDPNWTTAALDAEPVILFDINGTPQYYEFYLRNGGTIPGYFWTSANKLMGHGVFRLHQGTPVVQSFADRVGCGKGCEMCNRITLSFRMFPLSMAEVTLCSAE